jgi:hypothetical protein
MAMTNNGMSCIKVVVVVIVVVVVVVLYQL